VKRDQHSFNVAYYSANRDAEKDRVVRRQLITRDFLRSLKGVPCADCGRRLRAIQMDFDHRDPGTRDFWLMSGRAMLMPRHRLLAEVEKCDVVCANCHRVRSQIRHADRLASTKRAGSSPYIERRRTRWRNQAALLDRLRDQPCEDCGRRFPACAMDFDHRDPADKRAQVTQMIGRAGTASILAEAAKCDIVCANCHRVRTYNRRSGTTLERE
jgi:hypothetical protein